MGRPYALLRAGFPFLKTLGMRRVTNEPVDVAIASDGMAYVLNRGGQIARLLWDDDGTWDVEERAPLGGGGEDDGKFTWPVAVIMDREDNLFVSDEALHRITSITAQGEFLGKWGEFGDGDGQLNRPSGISFDADENIYVSDTLNHRIQKFSKDGKFLMKWGRLGDGDGDFQMPWGITVDELGDVYVADWRNDRVQKFTPEGGFIFKFGKPGSANGEFHGPVGVAVDSDGDIYVADTRNNRVQLFNAEGRYVEKFKGDATLSVMARDYMLTNSRPNRLRDMADLEPQKRLREPRSVRVDGQGRMYVPDFMSFRVQVYQKEVVRLTPDQMAPPLRSPSLETT